MTSSMMVTEQMPARTRFLHISALSPSNPTRRIFAVLNLSRGEEREEEKRRETIDRSI